MSVCTLIPNNTKNFNSLILITFLLCIYLSGVLVWKLWNTKSIFINFILNSHLCLIHLSLYLLILLAILPFTWNKFYFSIIFTISINESRCNKHNFCSKIYVFSFAQIILRQYFIILKMRVHYLWTSIISGKLWWKIKYGSQLSLPASAPYVPLP